MTGAPVRVLLARPDLYAVLKPAGLTVVPPRDNPGAETLRTRLEAQTGERLLVVHRLDRDTSGVVLLARTPEAHRRLSGLFARGRVEKTYLALCRRADPEARSSGRVDAPIGRGRRGAMRVVPEGTRGARGAATRYRVLGVRGDLAVVEAHPQTGRTHQVRVHLAHVGLPLAVDPRYGGAPPLEAFGTHVGRLTLHARRLLVPELDLDVTAPVPDDLAPALAAVLQRPVD